MCVKRGLLIAIALLWLSSCKYYEPVLKPDARDHPELLQALQGKALIIHGKKGIYLLAQPNIDTERQEISGTLTSIPPEHTTYVKSTTQTYRYKPQKSDVLSEVHIYAAIDTLQDKGSAVTIPFRTVERMEMIKPDQTKNTLAVVGSVLLACLVIVTVYFMINPPVTGL